MGQTLTGGVGATVGDPDASRGKWVGKLPFILCLVGVGIEDIWRFPYKVHQYGGGSFLVPYLLMVLLIGLPVFFLELVLGQYTGKGVITVWKCAPLFKGIGWAMWIVAFLASVYYAMIPTYSIFYFFSSFTEHLPWQTCKPEWEKEYGCVAISASANATSASVACPDMRNCSTAADIFWRKEVLHMSEGIDEGLSKIDWRLSLCLLFTWMLVYFISIWGVRSLTKAYYFTVPLPYIVLTILLVRNATLDGAYEGLMQYITPRWEDMKNINIWYECAVQVFYSLGLGFGIVVTMSSFNDFKNNVFNDTVMITVVNSLTAVFAGCTVFTGLGVMSHRTGLNISDVVDQGPGLIFVAIPESISLMPVIPPLWSALFFLMLFTVGIDTMITLVVGMTTALVDEYPGLRGRSGGTWQLGAALCVSMLLLGVPQCSGAGIYIVRLMDYYSAGFSAVIVAAFEVAVIAWFYGMKRFSADICFMLGYEPNIYWKATWILLAPVTLLGITIYTIVLDGLSPVQYRGYEYPDWAHIAGWVVAAAPVALIPIVMVITYCRSTNCTSAMQGLTQPSPAWGPRSHDNLAGPCPDKAVFQNAEGLEGVQGAIVQIQVSSIG